MDDDDWESADIVIKTDKKGKNDDEEVVKISSNNTKNLSKAEAEKLRIRQEQERADDELTKDLFGVSIGTKQAASTATASSSTSNSASASENVVSGGSMEDIIYSLPLSTERDHRSVGMTIGKMLELKNNPTGTKELCKELLKYACKILTEDDIAQIEQVTTTIKNQKIKENNAKKPKKKEKPSINNYDDFDNLGSFKGSRAAGGGGGRRTKVEDEYDFM